VHVGEGYQFPVQPLAEILPVQADGFSGEDDFVGDCGGLWMEGLRPDLARRKGQKQGDGGFDNGFHVRFVSPKIQKMQIIIAEKMSIH